MNYYDTDKKLDTIFASGLFQFFTFILLFVALLTRQMGLVWLSLLILLVFNGSRLWSLYSLRKLSAYLSIKKNRVFPWEEVPLITEVANNKFLPVWLQIDIPLSSPLISPEQKNLLTGSCTLLWHQKNFWQWDLPARKRGVYRAGPLKVKAGDILGFFEHEKKFEYIVEIIIYPRLIPLAPFTLEVKEFFGNMGLKSPVTDPVFPVATRDYYPGRPARFIHWKASARHGRLQEKIFEPSTQMNVLFIIDVRQFINRKENEGEIVESFEKVLEAVASLVVRYGEQGIAVGLATNGSIGKHEPVVYPFGNNSEQISILLEMLARLELKTENDFKETFLHSFNLPTGTVALYFTLDIDKNALDTAEVLQLFNIPVQFVTRYLSVPQEVEGANVHLLEEICAGEGDYS